MKRFAMMMATVALAACRVEDQAVTNEPAAGNGAAPAPAVELSLTRLDCGYARFREMNTFFSDIPGVYPPGPGSVANSCYLIRHGDQLMVWDTGFAAETKDRQLVREEMTAGLNYTLADLLGYLKVKPEDVDVVGISHMHGDHIGQAAQFANARLVIGKQDFELLGKEPDDTLKAWRGSGKPVTLARGDVDIFGDGSVVALHTPGHTPDHLALLVNLKSGAVLLTGDLYHSTISREKRSTPPFNTSKEQTLASMDKFEAKARELKAKVVIQHEKSDIAKLPAPESAN